MKLRTLFLHAMAIVCTASMVFAANDNSEEKFIDDLLPILLEAESGSAQASKPLTHIGGIDVPNQPYAQGMIQKYIRSYTDTNYAKKALCQTLDNGELYRLYIRQELKKRHMPAALEYLPVVESEYKPFATSRSGARGLWQFMENSIEPFMKKNEWLDERLDPWLSTDAALSKLQDNYRMFGDWPIAIAAYNCGAGAMKRILAKSPQKTFWYIAEKGLLRDQSVQYVPKFLAISELSEKGADYGIQLPEITKSTRFAEFDYVTVKSKITLERLASELRLDYTTLKMLNCALTHECTPPDASYRIRLPLGMEQAAKIALHSIAPQNAVAANRTNGTTHKTNSTAATSASHKTADTTSASMATGTATTATTEKIITHTVIKGETLYFLSRLYGCSVDDICEANGMKKGDVLYIGKTLYIPVKKAET